MPVTCTKISSKTGINVRDLVKIPISAINRKSTYPILELNFSSSSREKDNPERSCGSSNERFSRRRRKKTKKKRKKGAWRAKCVESSTVVNESASFLAYFSFVTRPFFGGWIDIINRNGSWVKKSKEGGGKKKKEGKKDGGEKIGRDKWDARFHTRRTYCFLVDD